MKKYRLHEIEALLELFSTEPFIFRPAELYKIDGDLKEKLSKYNIYLVARRPRISIQPDSLRLNFNEQTVEGVFSINLGLEIREQAFIYQNMFDAPITALGELDYPYDHLRMILGDSFPVQIRVHDVIRGTGSEIRPYSDLYIEYIGQSFGDDGNSNALNRLIGKTGKQGHGSLQKVLSDINAENPESEVHILLYSFEFYKKVTFGGAGPEPLIPFEDAPERFYQFFDAEVARKNRIDLVEAVLIRYFQPKYNDIYKKTFPKATHEILNTLFELDITGLSTSISTEEHYSRIYSEKVGPSCQHVAMYPILKEMERASFLDLACPMPEIIA
ncbi:hypothetical protein [Marinobacter xestospongiae]|uniref:PD-(D/E)XK family member n=1 Tax=Marinobacter xestospongiae TaxID=994319 RepID=A0ABU3W0Z6_9GAMM|nr:hypothetical protein [Marinobacter xestospongiae]MDV2080184.1 hypothetical protein [Marinobacter xestospongiae]